MSPDELIDAYAAAYEQVGGHPNRAARALGIAAVLELVADDIATSPLPPGVICELVRGKARDLVAAVGGHGSREGED